MKEPKPQRHPDLWVTIAEGRKNWRFECPMHGCAYRQAGQREHEAFCQYRTMDGVCLSSGAVNEAWRAVAAFAKYRMSR